MVPRFGSSRSRRTRLTARTLPPEQGVALANHKFPWKPVFAPRRGPGCPRSDTTGMHSARVPRIAAIGSRRHRIVPPPDSQHEHFPGMGVALPNSRFPWQPVFRAAKGTRFARAPTRWECTAPVCPESAPSDRAASGLTARTLPRNGGRTGKWRVSMETRVRAAKGPRFARAPTRRACTPPVCPAPAPSDRAATGLTARTLPRNGGHTGKWRVSMATRVRAAKGTRLPALRHDGHAHHPCAPHRRHRIAPPSDPAATGLTARTLPRNGVALPNGGFPWQPVFAPRRGPGSPAHEKARCCRRPRGPRWRQAPYPPGHAGTTRHPASAAARVLRRDERRCAGCRNAAFLDLTSSPAPKAAATAWTISSRCARPITGRCIGTSCAARAMPALSRSAGCARRAVGRLRRMRRQRARPTCPRRWLLARADRAFALRTSTPRSQSSGSEASLPPPSALTTARSRAHPSPRSTER
jgi:hypothetical protein